MTVKHATASVFVFAWLTRGWRVGLITHPRFGNAMIPGGHVEAAESQGEAALRELAEETGLAGARLVAPPAAPLPAGYRASVAAQPWWIAEYQAPGDSYAAVPHVHVDHLYVAVVDDPSPVREPEHPFGWHAAGALDSLSMFDDTRAAARAMLDGLDSLDGPADAGFTAALLAGLAGERKAQP